MSPNLNSNHHHTIPKSSQSQQHNNINNNRSNSSPLSPSSNRSNNMYDDGVFKKPIQKVTPSRNTVVINGNLQVSDGSNKTNISIERRTVSPTSSTTSSSSENYAYIKPNSPLRASSILGHNNVPLGCVMGSGTGNGINSNTSPKNVNQTNKRNSATWNRKMDEGKMSFTMRREIDKQKEELELIEQLKTVGLI